MRETIPKLALKSEILFWINVVFGTRLTAEDGALGLDVGTSVQILWGVQSTERPLISSYLVTFYFLQT